jgi:adenosyl cobinamide kinase/adenosyl cobinamide phosphate guanylyltransferase
MEEAARLLAKDTERELVIISAELGCGVVPADRFLREYREVSGRVNCYFAREARQVIRVICGVGTKIKEQS